jgi:hypothetical protein
MRHGQGPFTRRPNNARAVGRLLILTAVVAMLVAMRAARAEDAPDALAAQGLKKQS